MLFNRQTETQKALAAYQAAAQRLDELRRQTADARGKAERAESAAAEAAGTPAFDGAVEESARWAVRARALEAAVAKAEGALAAERERIAEAWAADARREIADIEDEVRRRCGELRKLLDKVARVLGTEHLPLSILFQPRYAALVEDDLLRNEPALDPFSFESELDRLLARRRQLMQRLQELTFHDYSRRQVIESVLAEAGAASCT